MALRLVRGTVLHPLWLSGWLEVLFYTPVALRLVRGTVLHPLWLSGWLEVLFYTRYGSQVG